MNSVMSLVRRDEMVPTTPLGASALAISISFTCIATVIVLVRLYTRLALIRNAGYDDLIIVCALITSILFMGFFIGEVQWGLGTHFDKLTGPQIILMSKYFYGTLPTYYSTIFLTKLSMLFQYYRIVPNDFHRVIFWITLAVLIAYSLWTILSSFLICYPVAYFWDTSIKGSCLDKQTLWFSNAAMNILLDVWILLLPIPAIYKLQLPSRQKFAVMLVFIVGGIVCLTSILRLTTLAKIANSTDPSYDNVGAATWSAIEANTGIFCACLPALKPLLTRIFPRFLTTSRAQSSRPGWYGPASGMRNTTKGYRQSRASGFHLCTIDVEAGSQKEPLPRGMEGIKVTTEVLQNHTSTVIRASEDSDSIHNLKPKRSMTPSV